MNELQVSVLLLFHPTGFLNGIEWILEEVESKRAK